MRDCAVCGVPASTWCGGCGNVSYCSATCQKKNWPGHKAACQPTKTLTSPDLGNYLVAGRDLAPGDLLLDEDVAVLGPHDTCDADGTRVCPGCYFPTHGYTCSTCHVPLCGPSCEADNSPHKAECETIARYGVGDKDILEYITALRFILLRQTEPLRYKKCRQLSTNLELRKNQPEFEETKRKAAEFCSLFPGLAKEEVVLAVLCILDTNTFQVLAPGSAHNLAGLYPRVALLNHGCVPNCRLIFRSDQRLEVRASVAIKKGADLLISYTPPFYTVIARNTILQRGKQFTCSCARCSDPQEMGLKVSSIRCSNCEEGALTHGEAGHTDNWGCDKCGHQMSYDQYSAMDAQLLAVQTRFNKGDVEEMKMILSSYSPKLTETHGLILETKQHLAAALGRVDGYRYDQMSQEDMDLKISISQDLFRALNVLEPGLSKSRGITLLDLAECQARDIFRNENDAMTILDNLVVVEEILAESYNILKYEDEKAIEGNVAKKAKSDLHQLRQHIASLKLKLKK